MRKKPSLKIIALSLCLVFAFFVGQKSVLAESPNLFWSSHPASVEEGDRITIDVKVRSTTQSINAISGSVSFPSDLVVVRNISKTKSIINFWTQEPKLTKNRISFEGVILNPGFVGSNGIIFSITFEAKKTGSVYLNYNDGGVLANDGLGSNLLTMLDSTTFKIIPGKRPIFPDKVITSVEQKTRLVALPVITEYSDMVITKDKIFIKGKGEPNLLTKIVFRDTSVKSLGEQLIAFLQKSKNKLDEILVKNNPDGTFEYTSPTNLLAGAYNATPFLVDTDNNVEKPGLGVQLLVSDSKVVKALVVVINVLGLLIPIVALCVIIYFIPWYSWRRMRVLRKKLGLEEEKIELSEHQLARQDKILDGAVEKMTKDNTVSKENR